MAQFFSLVDPFGRLEVTQHVVGGRVVSELNNGIDRVDLLRPLDNPYTRLIPVSVSGPGLDTGPNSPGTASLSGTAGEGNPINVTASIGGDGAAGALLRAELFLAPIVSQAPRSVPVEFGLTVSGVSSGVSTGAAIDFASISFSPPAGATAAIRNGVSSPAGSFAAIGDGRNGEITSNAEFLAGSVIDAGIRVAVLSGVSGVGSNSTTISSPRFGGFGTVVIDGENVPTNAVYVLRNVADFTTPVSADSYPRATGFVDGFDFDPTTLFFVRGGTVTARGVDEDGFGGNTVNIVEDLLVRVTEGASVLTIEDRDYSGTPIIIRDAEFRILAMRKPAIDLRGDRNEVENNGLIRTERTDNYGVLLDGLEVGLFNEGSIESAGDRSGAVLLSGPAAFLENNGQVSSVGDEVVAIEMLDQGANLLNRGDVLAKGDFAVGISIDNTSSFIFLNPDGEEPPANLPGAALVNSGNVIAEGANAAAVFAVLVDGTIDNLGSIDRSVGGVPQSESEIGAGLLLLGENVPVENFEGGSISSEGDLSPALAAYGSNIDINNAGEVTSAGGQSEGIVIVGDKHSFKNGLTGEIESTGDGSPAVRMGPVRNLENVLGSGIGAFDITLLTALSSDIDSADIALILNDLLAADPAPGRCRLRSMQR